MLFFCFCFNVKIRSIVKRGVHIQMEHAVARTQLSYLVSVSAVLGKSVSVNWNIG